MSTPSPESLLAFARGPMLSEVRDILGVLQADDMTSVELAALVAVLRPPYERLQARLACPVVALTLVSDAKVSPERV